MGCILESVVRDILLDDVTTWDLKEEKELDSQKFLLGKMNSMHMDAEAHKSLSVLGIQDSVVWDGIGHVKFTMMETSKWREM